MARTDRLFRLLQAMRMLPSPVTAARLAEETEVSLRSLYRDIDSLRAAGARIEGERGFGYRLIEDYALPPQSFDRAEIEAIALGMAEVQHIGDPVLAQAAAGVLAKIAAALPDGREQQLFHAISQVYRPEPRYTASRDAQILRKACWEERGVRIRYSDLAGSVTERAILPLAMVYTRDTIMVLSWCCLREAFRMFRVEQILDVAMTSTSFRPRRATLLREYLSELRARSIADP
jgi:predicted DNA-binding transcriptional regulator YafY